MTRSTGMRTRIAAGSRWRVVAAGACLLAGAAACSSGSSSTSTSAPPATSSTGTSSAGASSAASSAASAASTPASAGTSTAAAFAGSVTNYQQYVGGSGAANASLSPVTIGWVNEQGGPPSQTFPQATLAAQATVKFINSQLGGVHGHPVQLSTCFIAAVEAQGTTCGDQMVNTKGVEAIVEGIDAVGNASMYGVVNGAIPTLVGVSADPADDTGKNVFELEGSGVSATVAFGPFLRAQYPNDKTIAIAYQNLPGAVPISQAIQKSAQASGFTVTMIPYSATATDLIAQATQMEQAQITVPDCGFVDCPLMAKAMSEIGATKPALSVPLWTDLPGVAFPGGDLPHWIAGEATANLASPQDPGVAAYDTTIEANGLSAANAINPFSGIAFGSLLLAAKVMNTIPFSSLSPAAVTAALKSYTGPIPLGPGTINCSGTLYPADPNSCSDYDQFYEYLGHGQWKLLEGWSN
jgi:branched-chain amino acid transport system substrate-binding protein